MRQPFKYFFRSRSRQSIGIALYCAPHQQIGRSDSGAKNSIGSINRPVVCSSRSVTRDMAGLIGGGGGIGGDEFVLSRTLLSDGEPVRSLCYLPGPPPPPNSMDVDGASSPLDGTVVTGSQGAILTKFPLSPDDTTTTGAPGEMITISGGHSHQITALTSIPPGISSELDGGYVSGCKDNFIRVFSSDSTQECTMLLSGHENAVTSLSWVTLADKHTFLVSGSWDGTARIWNLSTEECVCVLPGHENTVCVQGGLPGGRLATGSAGVAEGNTIKNHKIRLWDLEVVELVDGVVKKVEGTCIKEVMDHGGPVRGLCLDPDTLFLGSCSNDGTVKVRDSTTGECLVTHTHPGDSTPLVLAVAAIGNGRFVSVTEDGAAVVWNPEVGGGGGGVPQVILHPDCVWCVLPLPNGDFATGCNDGVTRIFTTDATRCAPAQETAAFHDAVSEAKAKRSSGGPSAEEIAKLPTWESPHPVGRSEGQVQVFSKGGTKAIAAQWSVASGTWIEVGEVTGRNEDAGTIDGVRYDHVFPIEIDVTGGGVRTLQIGYNTGENPFVTAQAFIDEHELDQNYLAQIADYIRQRAGQAAPTIGAGGGGAGGGGGNASSFPSGSNASMGAAAAAQPAAPTFVHLPMKSFMTFDTGTEKSAMGKICAKIREFNTSLGDDGGAILSTEEEAQLDTLASTLTATSRYHSSKIDNGELNVVGKMLAEWPVDKAFPALDLARLVAIHPDASSSRRSGFWTDVFRLTLDRCAAVQKENLEGIAAVAVPMLSFRLFANSFKGAGSGVAVASTLKSVLDCAETHASSKNKNVRLSVATLALNASSLMLSSPSKHNSSPEQLLRLLHSIVGSGLYEGEAMTRALVALGTTLLVSDDVKATARSLDVYSAVTQNTASCGPKAKAVSEEIRTILGG